MIANRYVRIWLLLFIVFSSGISTAQVSSYNFSQSTGTYTALNTGATTLYTATDNAVTATAVNLGFTFTYSGTNYTNCRISTNGFLTLGNATTPSVSVYTPISNTGSAAYDLAIAGLARDLNATVKHQTLGTSPNRIFVTEWSSVYRYAVIGSENINFQIRLYETTNVVEVQYGSITTSNTSFTTGLCEVGLKSASTVYNNVTFTNANLTGYTYTNNWNSLVNGSLQSDVVGITSTIFPASGSILRWTPSSCAQVTTAATVSSITSSSALVSWTNSATYASGYRVRWRKVDEPYTASTWATPVAVAAGSSSYTISGLSSATYYVFSVEGRCSASSANNYSTVTTANTANGKGLFATACSNVTLPVAQGFNATTIPSCWTQQTVTGTSNIQYVASSSSPATTPQEGSHYVYWNSFSYASGNQTRLVSPPITTTGSATVNVRFYWFHDNSNYTTSGYATEGVTLQYSLNGTTWTDVQVIPRLLTGTNGWTLYDITLPAPAGNAATMYTGFLFTSRAGNNCSLDNVLIYAAAPCTTPTAQPTGLSLTNISSTALNGTFTAASPAPSGYVVFRSTSNTPPSLTNGTTYVTGNAYTILGNSYTTISNGTSTSFGQSSLLANTQYYFYVFSYNSSCTGAPFYLNTSPLTGTALTCTAAPATLSGTAASPTSASISFTAVSGAVSYILQYSVAGANSWTTASPAPTGSPYTLTGLTSGTAYDIRLQGPNSSCGTLTTINNAFTTPCVTATIPYSHNFNATTMPACWSSSIVALQTGTKLSFVTAGTNQAASPPEGTHFVQYNSFSSTNGGAGSEERLISAPVSTTGTSAVEVRFDWFESGNTSYTNTAEGVTVEWSTNGTTWNTVAAYPRYVSSAPTAGNWSSKIVYLPVGAGNQSLLYVGLRFHSEYGYNCYLDKFVIQAAVPCTTPAEQPVALNLTSVTSTSLSGSFTAANPAPTGYIVLRSTASTVPSLVNGTTYITGSSYVLGGNNYTVVSNGSSTSFSETTLAANTQYYYFIYAFNSACAGMPFYLNTNPLTGNILTCTAAPATLTGIAASSTSATISFGTVTGAAQYILQYSVAGANAWITASPAPATTPYTLNGLSAGTAYDIRLQGPNSNCGTLRTTSNAFSTACAALSLPVSQGFEASTSIPACWTQQLVSGSKSFSFGSTITAAGTSPNPAAAGGAHRLLFTSYSGSGNQTRLRSPVITTTGTSSVDVEFQWHFSSLGGNGSYLTEGVQVQWSTDGTNWNNTGSLIRRYGATTGWQKQTVTLPGGAGNQAVLYVGFLFTSNAGYDSYMDDVVVKATPPCNFPGTAAAATNSICGGSGTTTLSAVNYSVSGAGLSYQWQVSSDNISFSDLTGETNPASASTGTISATRYYRLRVFCTALGNSYSNSVSVSVGSYAITGTTPASRCGIGTVTLQASATPGSNISWYNTATGGIPLGSGSTYTTPEISATTNYYVAANNGISSAAIGPTYSGSNNNGTSVGSHGIVINTTSPNIIIVSAAIPFTGKGTFTIQLQTTGGTVISTVTTAEYTGGASVPVAIPLNLAIPTPGTYRLLITGITGTIDELGYISNAVYPYTGLGGAFSVTAGYWYGNDTNDNMYLFSLVVTDVCESARTLVTATVTPPPALTISSAAATICSGSSTAINVTSTISNFSSYSWSPAAGVTAGGTPTGSTVTLNPTSTTNYILTATSASGCVNKASALITVNAPPPTTTGAAVCSGTNATISATTSCGSYGNPTLQINGSWNAATDPVALRPIIYIANSNTCLFDDVITRNYTVQDFQVTVTGTYTFVMPNTTAFDGMGYIVTGPFVPGNCSGGGSWIVGDDDSGPTLFEPLMSATLTAGVTYTLITTTYSDESGTITDNYTWNITGPIGGAITTVSGGVLQWYTVPSGGSSISSASPFDPVGVAGSGIASNTSVGSYTFYAACSNNPTCRTATNYVIGAAGQWIGAANNVWSNTANWCGGVPTISTDAAITSGALNMPVLGTGTGTVRNLTVNSGASLTVSNATMQIAGTITASNAINAANGTIEMAGATAQSLSGSAFTGRTLLNLIASNSVNVSAAANDSLRITGALSFGNVNSKTFSSGDNVILVSGPTATARVADITNNGANSGNSLSGKFVVQRYMPPHRSWRLMTAPITAGAQTINQAWQENVGGTWSSNPFPGYGTHVTGGTARTTAQGFDQGPNNASIYGYSGTNWNYLPNTTGELVTSREGWMLFVRGSRAINLPLSNTGTVADQTILRPTGALRFGAQPAVTNAAGGFTVVGNPYACPIDFTKLTRSGVIGGVGGNAYYMWDPYLGGSNGVGAFVTLSWNGTSYDKTIVTGGGNSSLGTDGIIPSSAAIMVNLSPGGSIGIAENDKDTTIYRNSYAFRPTTTPSAIRTTLYAVLADGERALSDGTLITFDEQAQTAVDNEDAVKVNNFNENICQFREGKRIAIERRAPLAINDTLFYHTWNLRQRGYELEISLRNLNLPPATAAFLEDVFRQQKTALSLNDTNRIAFTVTSDAASAAQNRFRIIIAPASVVPVTFLNLDARLQQQDVQVEWTVANELNIAAYTVEHATDPAVFSELGAVPATGGRNPYCFTHEQPAAGIHYYRIRSTDRSGAVHYSQIVKVVIRKGSTDISVYPNPVRQAVIQVQFNEQASGKYTLQLFNSAGQLISNRMIMHAGGSSVHPLQLNRKPAAGNYELVVQGQSRSSISIIVE